MGLLDISFTELASRIARGANVRGRIRVTMDDGVIPFVQVADYTRAPFRTDEQKFFATRITGNGGAGNGTNIGINNQSPLPIVIEQVRIFSRGGAQAILCGFSPGMFGGADTAFNSMEGTTGVPGGPFSLSIAPGVLLSDLVTVGADAPSTATHRGEILASGAGPQGVWELNDLDILVQPGSAWKVCGTTLNSQFGVSARVRIVKNILKGG